uniref:Transmembrane protein n=1 Tax=Lepeophtheirus salmonis TaxID=72036 RepID=A0A0K2VDH6_LEPSM
MSMTFKNKDELLDYWDKAYEKMEGFVSKHYQNGIACFLPVVIIVILIVVLSLLPQVQKFLKLAVSNIRNQLYFAAGALTISALCGGGIGTYCHSTYSTGCNSRIGKLTASGISTGVAVIIASTIGGLTLAISKKTEPNRATQGQPRLNYSAQTQRQRVNCPQNRTIYQEPIETPPDLTNQMPPAPYNAHLQNNSSNDLSDCPITTPESQEVVSQNPSECQLENKGPTDAEVSPSMMEKPKTLVNIPKNTELPSTVAGKRNTQGTAIKRRNRGTSRISSRKSKGELSATIE